MSDEPTQKTLREKSEDIATAINLYGKAFLTVCGCLTVVGTVLLFLMPSFHLLAPILLCVIALVSGVVSMKTRVPSQRWPSLNAVCKSKFGLKYLVVTALMAPVISIGCILPMIYYGNRVFHESFAFDTLLCLVSWTIGAMMWLQLNRQIIVDWIFSMVVKGAAVPDALWDGVDLLADHVAQQQKNNKNVEEVLAYLVIGATHNQREVRDMLAKLKGETPEPGPSEPHLDLGRD